MTLLETITSRDTHETATPAAGTGWRVETTHDLESASRAWLSLEMSGVATPYQTLGWQRAAFAHLHAGAMPLLVMLRDQRGGTAGLLPLVVTRKAGIAIAAFPGGKHANYNMGLFTQDAIRRLDGPGIAAVLASAATAAGIDLLLLRNQPLTWHGETNPLALLPHQPAASGAWRADLIPDADAFIASLMSSESRKKLRHKERKLGDIGPLAYVEAGTSAEAHALLEAFHMQKKARFAAMGIANPFEQPGVRAFLDAAAVAPLRDGPPAPLSLFGLKIGDRVVAVFGAVIHAGRFSGMFTSFDNSPEFARYSPGDLLILHLVRMMCARGLRGFDLGVGDAAYKSDYCPIREELFDSFLPMTAKGKAAALLLKSAFGLRSMAARHKDRLKPLRHLLRR